MFKKISISSPKPQSYRTKKICRTVDGEHDIYHRPSLIPGFDQQALNNLRVNQIGAGGLGSEIGMGLSRKGIGELNIFDDDVVTITNLSRQLYYKRDLYKPKAIRLAKNISKMATNNSKITGYPVTFQDAVQDKIVPYADVVIVGVDDPDTRFFCSEYFYKSVPVIFTAVNAEADSGYVFLQEPGKACFGCVFADEHGRHRKRCVGAAIDINKTVAGIVTYTLDTLCMKRKRTWNYKRIHLSGFPGDACLLVEKDTECQFCKPSDKNYW